MDPGSDSVNEICLRTNSGEYVGGDTIYGTVYLKLVRPVQSRTLKLIIRGCEKTEYGYSYVVLVGSSRYEARNGKRMGKNPFLVEDIRMIEYPGGFPKGVYSFPFKYQLPHGLPGVCSVKNGELAVDDDHFEGNISYSVGAALVNPSPRPKLHTEAPIVVFDSLDCRNSQIVPDIQRSSGLVRTFFCLNRGKILASTQLDKNSYCSDEIIKLNLEIVNESSVDVLGATVTLTRVLKLLGHDETEENLIDHTSLETVLSKEHDGCLRGNTVAWKESLKLLERDNNILLPPTTSGKLVKCSYFIDMEIHCPWAPVIEVHQPLLIRPPDNRAWKAWSAPDWISQCTIGSVTQPLAVPRDELYSQSFAAMPGLGFDQSSKLGLSLS